MPEEVLVSGETGDDAAAFALSDGSALVATVDFFTPIVDDPFDWGRIAAANAFSDVYAMGATPRLALNIAAWPVDDLPLEMLVDVLRGGREVADRAGVVVIGGHTITDTEPKYGMAALGFVDPSRIVRKSPRSASDAPPNRHAARRPGEDFSDLRVRDASSLEGRDELLGSSGCDQHPD